jgi:hypothetical protein
MIKSIRKGFKKDPPKVTPNPKEKTISVTFDFGALGHIKRVKIIARRKTWLNWHWIEDISFEDIECYLSKRTLNKIKDALKDLYQQSPEIFNADFFNCVLYANAEENPDFKLRVKPRKPSPYDLSWTEKNEISATAIHLYVYFKSICRLPENKWPLYIDKFLTEYKIDKHFFKKGLDLEGIIENVISQYYGIDFSERFWQTFVTESPISIERVQRLKRINPEQNPFLLPIFKEFMS